MRRTKFLFFKKLQRPKHFFVSPCWGGGALTLQLVDKDNWDVCGLSAVDPPTNCGLASALCSRMLPCCPGRTWLNRSCLEGTVVGWLMPMVQSRVRARARVERCYRLQTIVLPRFCSSSCSSSGAAWAKGGSPQQQLQQQQWSKGHI